MRDNFDLMVQRLGRLVELLEQQELETTVTNVNEPADGTAGNDSPDQPRTDEPNEENVPMYFSTGPAPLAVKNTDRWERLDFGLVASTVNVRTTDDVLLAFANPNRSGPQFKIRGSESPFTIGGDAGIDTAFMWIKQAESAQNTPEVEIIAYR
jgi:hypothetical protein